MYKIFSAQIFYACHVLYCVDTQCGREEFRFLRCNVLWMHIWPASLEPSTRHKDFVQFTASHIFIYMQRGLVRNRWCKVEERGEGREPVSFELSLEIRLICGCPAVCSVIILAERDTEICSKPHTFFRAWLSTCNVKLKMVWELMEWFERWLWMSLSLQFSYWTQTYYTVRRAHSNSQTCRVLKLVLILVLILPWKK